MDVLVEFEPGHVPGFAFHDLQEELAGILGRRVDLHAPGSLSRYFRDRVLSEAHDQYVAAPQIPWRAIAGTRDRLVHAYFDVDLDRRWRIVTADLPPLADALESELDAATRR